MDMEDIVYDLTYLRNIKKITGALIVKNVATELQSLTFLQNLVTIENKGNDSLAIEIADVSWNVKTEILHSSICHGLPHENFAGPSFIWCEVSTWSRIWRFIAWVHEHKSSMKLKLCSSIWVNLHGTLTCYTQHEFWVTNTVICNVSVLQNEGLRSTDLHSLQSVNFGAVKVWSRPVYQYTYLHYSYLEVIVPTNRPKRPCAFWFSIPSVISGTTTIL